MYKKIYFFFLSEMEMEMEKIGKKIKNNQFYA